MEAKMMFLWGMVLFLAVWLVRWVSRPQGAMVEIPIDER